MLSGTVPDRPVLGLRDGLERVSKTQAVTAAEFEKDDQALAKALLRCAASVNKKVAGRERSATFYYVTYEAVIDNNDGDSGRPMRPPVDGEAAGVVLARLPEGRREAAAA